MYLMPTHRNAKHFRGGGGFTLAELLVVMAIIAILAVITVVAVAQISNDARLSSGVNAVTAALETARTEAMRRNNIVVVVFRPHFENQQQVTEVVVAEWSGEAAPALVDGDPEAVERYVPIPDVAPRQLPAGIKVGTPSYGSNDDRFWLTQSELGRIDQSTGSGETPGGIFGVMYSPDGSLLGQNSTTAASRTFVDFNGDGFQTLGPGGSDSVNYNTIPPPSIATADFNGNHFLNLFTTDEPYIGLAPFLVVYDDAEARKIKLLDWSVLENYQAELTGPEGYITQNATRIHFNRYSGVALR